MAETSDAGGESGFSDLPDTPEEMQAEVFRSLADLWEDFLARLPFLVGGLVVLAATWLVSRIVASVLRRVLASNRIRRSLRDLLIQLASVGVWVVGIIVAAVVIFPGMTPAKVLTGLGIGSVALGFAFKDIVENFIAGILILWRFPFDPGDFIACGDIEGQVEDITVRMTLVRRTNGELVAVPNAKLFKEPVVVRTSRDIRRMTVPAGVAYEADADRARGVIRRAVESCQTVSGKRPVEIFLTGLGSSSVDFEVTWWTGATPLDERRSRDEVVGAVKRALDEAGIEIPWPQRVVSFKGPLHVDRKESEDSEG
ncbi:mechanosensitive ion channel [Botrimarina sp.]|uniref:mechanosensitive ion channel family protein n=1 Tax=Botrimarina sp. TaxID=2795802 RepID=UPI0032EAB3DC